MAIPAGLAPMKAVSGPVPDGDGWAFEVKWDGMRVVADLGGPEDRAWSTNGRDVLRRFPELHDLSADLGTRLVVDGEIVVIDGAGRTDFGLLQSRMQVPELAAAGPDPLPITYVLFDLLAVGGLDTVSLPYLERRRLLTELVDAGPTWQVPAHRIGDGHDLYRAAEASGLEGIMAKRTDSAYQPGRRSAAWRKCKVRHRQEVVVGGWTTGEGAREATFGALHVGVVDPTASGAPLRHVGRVGTGFDDATLRAILHRLAPLEVPDCPFTPEPPAAELRGPHWVRPLLVAEVAFAHWTADGHLRHPTFLGLRDDKDPAEVVREPGPADPAGPDQRSM